MQVGVDIGGTFTDVLIVTEEGQLQVTKIPSTPNHPDEGVVKSISTICDAIGKSPKEIEFFSHGTTVATNAVLEGEWSDTALVTTAGFKDVLEIGRQDRPALYDLQAEKSPPVVPRNRRFEVTERVGPDGEVLVPFDDAEAREVAQDIAETGVSAVAVCFLNAYKNSSHEKRMLDILNDICGDITNSLSSQVHPEIREYERTTTTAMSAGLEPVMNDYLNTLRVSLNEFGVSTTLNVMQSNGGIITAKTAREKAVKTLLSGPAAGVQGATYISQVLGFDDIITMDMGGTSCDVSIVLGGEPVRSTELEVGDYPVRIPMVDVNTIGNGGGSKAWLDAGGALRVGPQSAGADPGPICYGHGGDEVTITDAHVLLGRVNPETFIGGDYDENHKEIREVIESRFSDGLGRTPKQIAQDILDVANANMLRALKVISTERGHDPREFTMVAFGGAGPLHATALGRELDVQQVLVPRHAGVLSALGLLVSDIVYDNVQSYIRQWDDVDPQKVGQAFQDLEQEGNRQLDEAEIPASARTFERSVDVRYHGQSFELTVPAPDVMSMEALEDIAERFHHKHRKRYGHASPEERLELVNIRIDAIGQIDRPSLDTPATPDTTVKDAVVTTRDVYFDGKEIKCQVYDREGIPPGSSLQGPAIVEGKESTSTVYPDQEVRIDEFGNLIIKLTGGR